VHSIKNHLFFRKLFGFESSDKYYSGNKQCIKSVKNLTFNGIVDRKFIDNNNHGYSIVELHNYNGDSLQVNLTFDNSGLFEFLEKNDSVEKISGGFRVRLFRTSLDTTFILGTDCL
jgi:hypothetical protein